MALFSSFVPDGGRIEKVSIYPSEFGKERMQQEELEGPPKEIFRKSKSRKKSDRNEDSDEEIKRDLLKEENDQDFDSDALRIYQLDRLRYYYAVMVCSDKKTAEKIYQDTDGREYQSSSNIIDLRFVPDDVTFEDEPRDECDKVPEGYRPLEFTTDALQHSKVKLTWDLHPEEASRSASMKNAFRGSRADIDENDLRAYLASDSEDDQAAADETTAGAEEQKMSKKELARKRMREALGLSSEPDQKPSKKGAPVGNMEITFATALSSKEALKTNDKEGETTLEKYMRKERERKAKKKKERAGKSTGEADAQTKETPDLGFDDPFFTAAEETKPSAAKIRKEEWRKKREVREAEEQQNEEERKQLELLMDDDDDGGEEGERRLEHFDMAKILRAEKEKAKLAKRKGKKTGKSKAAGQESGLQEGFVMDLEDPRFSKVFTDPEFAIDPSHPEFRSTESMRRLLAEKRRKRSAITGELDAVDAGNPDIYGADRQRTKVRKLEER